MPQIYNLEHKWIFKCHFCKDEFHDSLAIGIHFRDEHEYNLLNDDDLI